VRVVLAVTKLAPEGAIAATSRRIKRRRFEEDIETLEAFPERCPFIPENEILGTYYRHVVVDHYRCVFRIAKTTLYMLRVVHGARLLDSSMFEG
jgi:toxin ParE1/3/4